MGMFRGGSSPVSRSEYEKILTTLTSIIAANSAKTVKWELALKALVCMGSFIDQYHESEKAMSYMGIVVENLVSLVRSSHCSLPHPMILEATSEVCSTRPTYVEKMVQGFEEAFCSSFSDFCVSLCPHDSRLESFHYIFVKWFLSPTSKGLRASSYLTTIWKTLVRSMETSSQSKIVLSSWSV